MVENTTSVRRALEIEMEGMQNTTMRKRSGMWM
jgi:hypothetical protein